MADKRQASSNAALRRQSRPSQAQQARPTTSLCLAAAAFAFSLALAGPAQAETISGPARVLDGDTLAIAGQKIRFDAIDAPETRQTCTRDGRPWACGKAATQGMHRLIAQSPVRCEISKRGRYGRAIGACFANGRDLQQQLVRQGLALAYRRYSTRYVPEEEAARAERVGLWSGEFTAPWLWRKQNRNRPATRTAPSQPDRSSQASSPCRIKGNITNSGRIYHLPGGHYYDRTRINEDRGERWFCTEANARAAGWRRSRR